MVKDGKTFIIRKRLNFDDFWQSRECELIIHNHPILIIYLGVTISFSNQNIRL